MREIENKVLNKAIQMLNALKCDYAIVDSDGNTHGELRIQPSKAKRPLRYPYGSITKHIRPYLEGAKVGDIIRIPIKPFDKETIAGSTASLCCKLWGIGHHTAGLSTDGSYVEVFKIGDDNIVEPKQEKTEAEKQDELFEAWLK